MHSHSPCTIRTLRAMKKHVMRLNLFSLCTDADATVKNQKTRANTKTEAMRLAQASISKGPSMARWLGKCPGTWLTMPNFSSE